MMLHLHLTVKFESNYLRWTAEEGVGQGWEILGDGQGGYGSGFGEWVERLGRGQRHQDVSQL